MSMPPPPLPHEAADLLESVAAQLGHAPEVLMAAEDALADVYRAHCLEDAADACDRIAAALAARAADTARAEWEALPRHLRAGLRITGTAWVQRRTDQIVFAAANTVRAALERAATTAQEGPAPVVLAAAA